MQTFTMIKQRWLLIGGIGVFVVVAVVIGLIWWPPSPPPPPNGKPPTAPPTILSLEFPSVIPPDGSKQKGLVTFQAYDEDVTLLRLEVLEAKNFSVQEFPLGNFGQRDLLGSSRQGRFVFTLGSTVPQYVRLRAILIDRRDRPSQQPWEFSFSVEGIQTEEGVVLLSQWGRTGSGAGEFKSPRHLAVDKDGYIYVADTGNHRISKFDSKGNFVKSWGRYGTRDGEFNAPSGLAIDRDGNLYVADSLNHRIQKFTRDGDFLKINPDKTPVPLTTLGAYGKGLGQFYSPYAIAADSAGSIYVTDTFNHRIQKFDSRGELQAAWGEYGTLNEKFNYPWGVAVDQERNVYIADSGNHRIQKFDKDGNFSATWGSEGRTTGQFVQPWGIAIDPKGNVYIVDSRNHRVQKFYSYGGFIAEWGRYGNGPGEFAYPIGIAIDDQGYIYVADSGNNRIQKFWVNK
jgi:DNA-binding beta-propeller fold protein YncE